METKSKRNIFFVVNPKAGTNAREDYLSIISEASEKYDFQYKIYETRGEDDDREILNYIKEYTPETVVAVGGDGTVNLVARELAGTGINLGIVPAGSANGLAYNLDIPGNIREAIDIIMKAPAEPLDVISINEKYYCLHLSDVGINARIVKRFEEEGSKGLFGYGKQLFKELLEGKTSFSLIIKLPGMRPKKLKAEMLVIANAKRYGTSAIISPGGEYNDGRFEIIVIKPYPWWFVFNLLYAFLTGRLDKMKYIRVFSVSEAFVNLMKPQEFQIDGEIVPEVSSLKIQIMPEALRVLGA